MAKEFLVEETDQGRIGGFTGRYGTFYDVWSPDNRFLGTCGDLETAREMQRQHLSSGKS